MFANDLRSKSRIYIVLLLTIIAALIYLAAAAGSESAALPSDRPTAPAPVPTCVPPPSQMISWWTGDQNTADITGGHHGTLGNHATYAAGKVGKAFDLDGTDDFVEVPASSAYDFGAGDFTIDAWIYARSLGGDSAIVSRWDASNALAWDFRLGWGSGGGANNKLYLFLSDNANTGIVVSDTVSTNAWHHVAVVRSGGVVYGYLDGVEFNAGTHTGAASGAAARLRIGRIPGFDTAAFNGLIDEAEVIGRALTGDEIRSIYYADLAGKCRSCVAAPTGVVGWWTADGHANDVFGTNHGDLVNFPAYDTGKVGNSFFFNGSSYVVVPDAPALRPATFTVAAWVNPVATSGNRNVVFKGDHEYLMQVRNGTVLYGARDAAGNYSEFQGSLTIPADAWTHLAITFDGTTRRIYVNGMLDPESRTMAGHYTENLGTLKIGTHNVLYEYFSGRIDEVGIWNRALAGDEIMSLVGADAFGQCRPVYPRPKPRFDFDGDLKDEIAVFRPSGANGAEWWISKSSGGVFATQFGAAEDKMVPVDLTGDGKTDIAFFRPSTGFWYVLRSDDLTYYAFPFGSAGDIPAPADYDGDGKADPAVFRPSTAVWYMSWSTGRTVSRQFGLTGDQPVPGDYDGDRLADPAVFRPSGQFGAEWWIAQSSGGVFATQFGQPADKAVPADYTGDKRFDIAVWDTASGFWYILRSDDLSYYAFPFGAPGDKPVSADYDGDGKADPGVFRPAGANWYANKSGGGTLIQQFGQTGDLPVPNAFVR